AGGPSRAGRSVQRRPAPRPWYDRTSACPSRGTLQMMPLFAVATMRADPEFTGPTTRLPLNPNPTAPPVANLMLPPGGMSRDVALGSLTAAPPGSPKTSIPTRMGAPVVFLQGKKVARSPPLITPGTDQRWKDGCPRSVGGGELI